MMMILRQSCSTQKYINLYAREAAAKISSVREKGWTRVWLGSFPLGHDITSKKVVMRHCETATD